MHARVDKSIDNKSKAAAAVQPVQKVSGTAVHKTADSLQLKKVPPLVPGNTSRENQTSAESRGNDAGRLMAFQLKAGDSIRENTAAKASFPIQKKANTTGLPDNLKAGVENLSGYDISDVRVHYNSAKPSQLQAHAYARGSDIHVAPGQEKHLPHEAWHIVQQKQGRVQPTMQMKGSIAVNDDAGLEQEADAMGAKAVAQRDGAGPIVSPQSASSSQPVVLQGEFETLRDIGSNNPALMPGMALMEGGGRIGMAGAEGMAASARFAATPAMWAHDRIQNTDSRLAQFGYGAAGLIGSAVSVPLGLVGGALAGGVGLAGAATVGGAGAATTAVGGLLMGAGEGIAAARNFSLDRARGIYPASATHPVYGDQGMRAPLPPVPAAGAAAPVVRPGISAPIPIPPARRDSLSGFMPGGPASGSGFMDRGRERLLSSVASDDFEPQRQYGSFAPADRLSSPSHGGRAAPGPDSLLLGDGADFDAARTPEPLSLGEELSLHRQRQAAAPRAPLGQIAPVPAGPAPAPLNYAPEYGTYNPDGSRMNYGMERKRDLAEYGVLGSGIAASAAGRIAALHGDVDTSAASSVLPFIQGFGGAAGILGAAGDLAEAGKGVKGVADSSRNTGSRVLSGMQAASALGSATRSSATAAWNLGSLTNPTVMAGAQAAAGGAAIATGGLDIIRGVSGAAVAHGRMNRLAQHSASGNEQVRGAAEVASASQERERTKGIATAIKGGAAVAGGVLLTLSMATPVGWALLGGAALIGGIAALYNYKKKGDMKEKVAVDTLGVHNEREQWKLRVEAAKAATTWGTTRRRIALLNAGRDPLNEALASHGFQNVGHFYSNYINYTANYLFQEGVANNDMEVRGLITDMGLTVNPPAQPTPEKIAKQISI